MPSLEQIKEVLKTMKEYLEYLPILIFLLVGIWVAAHHLKERLADYLEWFRDEDPKPRVRTTIVKDMMENDKTQTVKLRRLRVSKSHSQLVLDPWPSIIPVDSEQERPAELEHFYSVPGRLGKDQDPTKPLEDKFKVFLGRDEQLKKHREHSTLLVYTLGEKIDVILTPPYFVAAQPVGKESFTYEVHFPADRKFVRNKNIEDPYSDEEPRIKVYKGVADKKNQLLYERYGFSGKGNLLGRLWAKVTNRFRTRYHVIGGRADFGDKHGQHDWFRVTVLRPPQDKKIRICWCMQGDPITWAWCSHTEEDHKKQ